MIESTNEVLDSSLKELLLVANGEIIHSTLMDVPTHVDHQELRMLRNSAQYPLIQHHPMM